MRLYFQSWRRWIGPVVLAAVAMALRVAYYDRDYVHADEPITVEVVGHMRSSGDWDTNWAKANLEKGLRYDQYNFSSHLRATFVFYRLIKLVPGLESWRSQDRGFWVYRMFSVLLATAVVLQTWWLARRMAGPRTGLAAGALVAVAPILVQDAHYSRPEAFLTMIMMAAAEVSLPSGQYRAWRVFAGALLVGLAVACKVSMLALVWLPLVPLLTAERIGWPKRWLVALGLVAVGLVAGFALGAPGALANPAAFRHGVEYLARQYAGLHPPHSNVDGGMVAGMLAGYFTATLGWVVIAAGGVGTVALCVRRSWAEAAVTAGPVALFVGYFCTRSVFFERNLSHVVPLFCVLAAVGLAVFGGWMSRRWRWSPVLVFALLFAGALIRPSEMSVRLVATEFSRRNAAERLEMDERVRAAHPGLGWRDALIMNEGPLDDLRGYFAAGGAAVLVRVVDYHDEWSARYGSQLPVQFEAKLVGARPSTFTDVPGCTLHTYGGWTDRYYLVTGVRKNTAGMK